MTKRLETLFGLNDDDDTSSKQSIVEETISSDLISEKTLATIEKVEKALPEVKGLDATDDDLDEFSDLAKEAFNNLMDLGFQVDARFSAEIFNSASSMLGHAIGAKTSKMNKKLRMIDLQLKKAELDRKISVQQQKNEDAEQSSESENLGVGHVIDRNSLIKQILEQVESDKNSKKDK
jgi:hypothetical protein